MLRKKIGYAALALGAMTIALGPSATVEAAPGDQLSLTAIGQFFFPADERVTSRSTVDRRRVDLRAIVSSSRVGIDVTDLTPRTDFGVDAVFVCTGGREASVNYEGDSPLSRADDRFLRCGSLRRGESIFGAIGLFEPN